MEELAEYETKMLRTILTVDVNLRSHLETPTISRFTVIMAGTVADKYITHAYTFGGVNCSGCTVKQTGAASNLENKLTSLSGSVMSGTALNTEYVLMFSCDTCTQCGLNGRRSDPKPRKHQQRIIITLLL